MLKYCKQTKTCSEEKSCGNMEGIFQSSVLVLQNMEPQFTNEFLENKPWSEDDQNKFWTDLNNLTSVLKMEINKLALVVDVSDQKSQRNPQDAENVCKNIEQICVTLWSTYLRLSPKAGMCLCQSIGNTCQTIIRSTCDLLVNLSKLAKRSEALQRVGEIWEKIEHVQNSAPRDNVQAVCQQLQAQRNLVQDALNELEEAKNSEDDEFMEEKWSENQLLILQPALGLFKTTSVLLKKLSLSIKQNGALEHASAMDQVLETCLKISPCIDDLAMPLYPPMALNEVDMQTKILINLLTDILSKLKHVPFVTAKEHEEWCAFIMKAVDHNASKLNIALANEQLNDVEIKEN